MTLSNGSSVLNLDNGRTAAYLSGSGTNTLKFVYTIAAGDDTTSLGVTAFNPGAATIADGSGNPAALTGISQTFTGLGIDTTPPTVSSPTLTVGANTGLAAIGIAAPSDPADNVSLTITVTALPSDGTVYLSNGVTAVTQNELLSVSQLTGVRFAPAPNISARRSAFTYSVSDPAGNTATGTVALVITSGSEVPAGIYDPLVETGNTKIDTTVYFAHNTGSHAILENAGTMTVEPGGTIVSDGFPGDIVINDQGAEFDFNVSTILREMIPFQNNGLLVISPGAGNTDRIESYPAYTGSGFVNVGTVHVESGTFNVDRGATSNASSFAIDAGATLLITGASSAPPFTFAGGTYSVEGTTEVGDASGDDGYLTFGAGTTVEAGSPWLVYETVDMSAATVVGTFTDLVLTPAGGRGLLSLGNNSVTINGLKAYDANVLSTTGTITLTGVSLVKDTSNDGGDYTIPWTAQAVNNEGILILDHEVLDLSGGAFNNSSTINMSGGGIIANLQNSKNATLNLTNGGLLEGAINNAGLLNLDGTISFLRVQGNVTNTGTIRETGTIYFTGGLVNDGVIEGSDAVSSNSVALTMSKTTTVAGTFAQSSQSGTATLTNTGLIDAATGLVVDPTDTDNITLTNSSIIEGTSGTAVQFGPGNDRLILDPGSAIVGKVDGGAGNNTLELAVGSGSGAVSGIGTNFVNFSNVMVDAGAEWQVGVAIGGLAGETITGDGLSSLALEGAGAGDLSQASGFANIYLDSSSAENVTLTDANFVGTSGVISVHGGNVDTVVFSGLRSNYQITYADGGLAISSSAGTDMLTNIQTLQFADIALTTLDSNATAAVAQFDDSTDTGHIFIQTGTTVSAGAGSAFAPAGLDLGGRSGGEGDALVMGIGALLTNAGQFLVGDAGVGALSVLSGGTVTTSAGAIIANTTSASGSSINVTGPGSNLNVIGALIVGSSGSGSLSLAQGGTVTASSLDLSATASGDGVVSVTGTGSTLTLTGSLTVGDQAAGELSILSGAFVSALDVTVGNASAASSGNVDIEGVGSTLKVGTGGVLNIGVAGGGSGVLTIGTGATLNFNGTIAEAGHASFNNNGGTVDPVAVEFTTPSNAGLGLNQYDLYVGNINAVQITSGTGTWDTPMVLTGTSAADAANNINNNSDVGEWQLSQGGTLVINANTVDAGQNIVFQDATDTLVIGQVVNGGSAGVSGVTPTITAGAENLLQAGGFQAAILGYQAGDQILFNNMIVASDSIVNNNTLELFGAGNLALGSLTFYDKNGRNPLGATAMAAAAAQMACFAAGTLIETVHGPVAVEALKVGDQVVTLHGGAGQIVWVGERSVDCTRHPQPDTVWPVRIAVGAFGPGLPGRDLFLSPDHAVFVNGVLVPAKLLINRTSVVQVKRDRVMYYHVELPEHAVILAEGLTVESYLDVGDRANFNADNGTIRLFPDFEARLVPETALVWEMRGAAPLVMTGSELEAARQAVLPLPKATGGRGMPVGRRTGSSTPA